MITYIEVERLHPHPDNPRMDLGDLSELTESIKVSGVLQNLTVVPIPDMPQEYYVVIGNRRLAASVKAGIEKLPCSIRDMDEKQQVATMLLENIQRDDLTAYEQAQGFQMMLDLGETVAGISQKTGLSETTVRHRVKLCELDQDVLKEKSEDGMRNITMTDLIKLEQIKDPRLKNRALGYIGTDDFAWQYKKARQEEENIEKKNYILEKAAGFANEIEDPDGKDYVGYIYYFSLAMDELSEKMQEVEDRGQAAYFKIDQHSVTFYNDPAEEVGTDEDEEDARARDEEDAKRAMLNDIYDQMAWMRDDFVKKISEGKINDNRKLLLQYAARYLCFNNSPYDLDEEKLLEFSGVLKDGELSEENDDGMEALGGLVETATKEKTLKVLFSAVYMIMSPPLWRKPYSLYREYMPLDELNGLYEFLEWFGYKVSGEERQMLDGTHELYLKENLAEEDESGYME